MYLSQMYILKLKLLFSTCLKSKIDIFYQIVFFPSDQLFKLVFPLLRFFYQSNSNFHSQAHMFLFTK